MIGAVKLTKHPDYDQHKSFWYAIGSDRKGCFSFSDGTDINVITFGVHTSSSPHIDNNKKDILILEKDPTQ